MRSADEMLKQKLAILKHPSRPRRDCLHTRLQHVRAHCDRNIGRGALKFYHDTGETVLMLFHVRRFEIGQLVPELWACEGAYGRLAGGCLGAYVRPHLRKI